jgi:hypothetical protein
MDWSLPFSPAVLVYFLWYLRADDFNGGIDANRNGPNDQHEYVSRDGIIANYSPPAMLSKDVEE